MGGGGRGGYTYTKVARASIDRDRVLLTMGEVAGSAWIYPYRKMK